MKQALSTYIAPDYGRDGQSGLCCVSLMQVCVCVRVYVCVGGCVVYLLAAPDYGRDRQAWLGCASLMQGRVCVCVPGLLKMRVGGVCA